MLGLIIYFAWLTIVNIVPKFHHGLSLTGMQRSEHLSVRTDRFARPHRCSLRPTRISPGHRTPRLLQPSHRAVFTAPVHHTARRCCIKSVCCKYMCQVFQTFQMYIVSVPYGCCKKKVDLDIAYVAMAIHICCRGYTHYCKSMLFHLLQTYIAGSAFMV
jgi:hypothetical protein